MADFYIQWDTDNKSEPEVYSWTNTWGDNCFSIAPKSHLVPKQIIFQPEHKVTVVYWKDGTKTIVRASENEEFVPEYGLAMATMKKIYGTRAEFLRTVEKGYIQKLDKQTKTNMD